MRNFQNSSIPNCRRKNQPDRTSWVKIFKDGRKLCASWKDQTLIEYLWMSKQPRWLDSLSGFLIISHLTSYLPVSFWTGPKLQPPLSWGLNVLLIAVLPQIPLVFMRNIHETTFLRPKCSFAKHFKQTLKIFRSPICTPQSQWLLLSCYFAELRISTAIWTHSFSL